MAPTWHAASVDFVHWSIFTFSVPRGATNAELRLQRQRAAAWLGKVNESSAARMLSAPRPPACRLCTQLGTHLRGKKKREEMANVMRKQAKAHK